MIVFSLYSAGGQLVNDNNSY